MRPSSTETPHAVTGTLGRAVNLSLTEATVRARCEAEQVGVSAIEALPEGGVRLVCMSVDGAATVRRKFKTHLMKGNIRRAVARPTRPLW
jgi:hypothetical protein